METCLVTFTLVLLVATFGTVRAHSNLGYPLPYNRVSCKATERWCTSTCPPVWRTGKARALNSPAKPAAFWRRGQRVRILYHKNNHHGGFFRRSLVPVRYMFSKAWHRRGVFEWGCWSQGEFNCGFQSYCGTDKLGRAYQTWMTVPRVFPDGDYVFVHAWYGGMHWRNHRPAFSDYHSCAFVRIRGGPRSQRHVPTFHRGKTNRRGVPPGKCETGKYWLGSCRGAPCKLWGVKHSRPGPFLRGRRPAVVHAKWYTAKVMRHGPVHKARGGSFGARTAIVDKRMDARLWYERVLLKNRRIKRMKARRRARIKRRRSVTKRRLRSVRRKLWGRARIKCRRSLTKFRRHSVRRKRWAGPVGYVAVFVGGRMVRRVFSGQRAYIPSVRAPVTFEAVTGHSKTRMVVFRIRGLRAWIEKTKPFVFYGNNGRRYNAWTRPIRNRWFTLFVDARAFNGRWYSTRVKLYLKR